MTPPVQYTSTEYPTTMHPRPAMTPKRDARIALTVTMMRAFALSAIVTTVVTLTGHARLDSIGLTGMCIVAGYCGSVIGRVVAWVQIAYRSKTRGAAHATRTRPTF